MRRLSGRSLVLACLIALIVACFGDALFRDRQFGYRDAAHFYYPLYQRVQQVWQQGRLPVWDARENAGMPLLGNPTAAVLYPGKLVFAAMPYPWAARIYIVLHAVLAVVGMGLMMRSWGVGLVGSAIAGLSYGFGAPILFQYCNVIYLVGAAWVPWGLRSADRWVRLARPWGVVELAVILAMQVLGGDPQAAYLVGLCALGYAAVLSAMKAVADRGWRVSRRGVVLALIVLIAAWVAISLFSGWFLPRFRVKKMPPPPFFWSRWVSLAVLACWGVLALVMMWIWWRGDGPEVLPRMISGLIVSASLAGAVSAAQLLPVLEFTRKTERASEDGTHDIFPFSLEYHRVAEFVWPGIYGQNTLGNRSWQVLIPPLHRMEFWVPSLYLGGFTLVLALAGCGFRDPRRGWLTALLLVSLMASFGRFGSPLWVARNIPNVARWIGPLDPTDTGPIRRDYRLRDGEGGFYWLMATAFPGLNSFRYPSKLLTFTVVALAGLAGLGWEDVMARRSRRAIPLAGILLLLSLAGLAGFQVGRPAILKVFKDHAAIARTGSFGPFDVLGAWQGTRDAFLYGAILFAASLMLLIGVARSGSFRKAAGPLAMILVTIDLILANAGLIYTVPQSLLEGTPEVLKWIEEAERRDPSPGPYRVHRMPSWEPPAWAEDAATDRVTDLVRWERKTIQPKYGLPLGVSYTLAMGVGELYDYDWFFSPFHANLIDPKGPRVPENKQVYYPRRGFDLWNTRYFVIPALNRNEETHAISSFLVNITAIKPRPDEMDGPENAKFQNSWMRNEDWRVVRNNNAFPRSWIVHDVEIHRPIPEMRTSEERQELTYRLLYQADRSWTMTNRTVYDLRSLALVESDLDTGLKLARSLSRLGPDPSETAEVRVIDDETVEIDARLNSPGLVILSDVVYPGWEATIDDEPTPIYRTNRLMRGVAVPSGHHTVKYRYRSPTIAIGIGISGLGLIGLALAGVWAYRVSRTALETANL